MPSHKPPKKPRRFDLGKETHFGSWIDDVSYLIGIGDEIAEDYWFLAPADVRRMAKFLLRAADWVEGKKKKREKWNPRIIHPDELSIDANDTGWEK